MVHDHHPKYIIKIEQLTCGFLVGLLGLEGFVGAGAGVVLLAASTQHFIVGEGHFILSNTW